MKYCLLIILVGLFGLQMSCSRPSEDIELSPVISGIKNGQRAEISEFPFMANLVGPRGQLCGGALIAPAVIMTAAHCVLQDPLMPEKGYKYLEVYMGEQTANGHGGIALPVAKMAVHPEFRWPRYDIALIFLKRPVINVAPLLLSTRSLNFSRIQNGVVAGWGSIDAESASPRHLQKAQFEIASYQECGQDPQFIQDRWRVTEDMICIRTPQDLTTCPGDSGGPLMQAWRGQYVAIGVSSWGSGCRKTKQFGYQGFSDVASAYPWIRANLHRFENSQLRSY